MSKEFTKNQLNWLKQVAKDRDLPPAAMAVAVVLAGYVNRESGWAWPSVPTLAKALGYSANIVRKALHALRRLGHLDIKQGGFSQGPNLYRWLLKNDVTTEANEGTPLKPRSVIPPTGLELNPSIEPKDKSKQPVANASTKPWSRRQATFPVREFGREKAEQEIAGFLNRLGHPGNALLVEMDTQEVERLIQFLRHGQLSEHDSTQRC